MKPPTIIVQVNLTAIEYGNLLRLADYRKLTIEECIKDFARKALPGGKAERG